MARHRRRRKGCPVLVGGSCVTGAWVLPLRVGFHYSAQLRLLWGLWRTTEPLGAGAEPATAARGWSFSTFEPLLSGTDGEYLPDLVFRSQQSTAPPGSIRPETTV